MTETFKEKSLKNDFLNRVVDIRAKISSALDDLKLLTGEKSNFFSPDDVESIRDSIKNISSATSLVLTDTITAVAPEELLSFNSSCSLYTASNNDLLNIDYDKDTLSLLPDMAAQIVNLLGVNQSMTLFKHFGGSTFPIGKGLRYLGGQRAKALRAILSANEIKKLQDYFQGEIVYLPRCDRVLREVRNRQFLREFTEMRQQGVSSLMAMTTLCPRHGFSDRYAWQLLKKERDSQQS